MLLVQMPRLSNRLSGLHQPFENGRQQPRSISIYFCLIVAVDMSNFNSIAPYHFSKLIDHDCCYYCLQHPGTELFVWSIEPLCKSKGVKKQSPCPFLPAGYEVRLLTREICGEYPSHEIVVLCAIIVLAYRIKSTFYCGNLGPNEIRVVFDCFGIAECHICRLVNRLA